MKLEEYLEAIKLCPDEKVEHIDMHGNRRKIQRLTFDFGVYDNWSILLNADIDRVVEDLGKKDFTLNSKKQEEHDSELVWEYWMSYDPGTIKMQVLPYITGKYFMPPELSKKQRKNYNMTLILHPYQDKKIEGISPERAMAIVIDNLAKYIKENKISMCFPCSMGWNNIKDFSKVVYWPE